jgi:hypothetical protein
MSFGLAGFLAVNALASSLTVLLWRFPRFRARRAGSLFLLRMMPSAVSAIVGFGLVVPSFVLYEPRGTAESVGIGFVILVALFLVLVGHGPYRALTAWWATRRLVRAWLEGGARIVAPRFPVPVYRVRSDLPLAAVVGVIRPRVLISDRLFETLSPVEAQAVLSHELGHLDAFDNLKRTLIRLTPDWLSILTVGREIDAAWASAVEESADDHAIGSGRAGALDLASALLKAARMWPAGAHGILPASNFGNLPTISRRVTRLLDDAPASGRLAPPWALRVVAALTLVIAAALLAGSGLETIYTVTESAIRILP